MATAKRQLRVSEGPPRLGRFVLYDMHTRWSGAAAAPREVSASPADPALESPAVQSHLKAERAR